MAEVHPALLASDEERLLRPRRWCGRGLAVAAILTASQAIFGGYAIIVKIAINSSVDTLVFSLLRDIGASVVLLSACALMGERRPIAPGDRATFVGVGLFGITISQTAMVRALQWVPPFNASLLQPTQPWLSSRRIAGRLLLSSSEEEEVCCRSRKSSEVCCCRP